MNYSPFSRICNGCDDSNLDRFTCGVGSLEISNLIYYQLIVSANALVQYKMIIKKNSYPNKSVC